MVWLKSTEQESCADVAFMGASHNECMNKLKGWFHLNRSWVDEAIA